MKVHPTRRCEQRRWPKASIPVRAISAMAGVVLLVSAMNLRAQDTSYPSRDNLIPGPECLDSQVLMVGYNACMPNQLRAWRKDVFNWRDESRSRAGYTRAAILRGGSYYQPQGSKWYFPKAFKNTEHGKYLLMAPSKHRAGTVGFRCVMDAAR